MLHNCCAPTTYLRSISSSNKKVALPMVHTKVLCSITSYCVETLVALHTLHDHEYVSMVANTNRALSPGIHFGYLFVVLP